ncbi:MAG: DNA repair protein RecO [Oscillospiraceae bacterium]
MQLKTKGIILKQRNIGENDRILTILTSDFGLIEATARGVKSTRSALSASCQILSYSDICLYKGKGNYIVNSAETINSFYSLRLDIVKIALAGYFCELTSYLSPTTDNANDYIKLLLNSLYLLQENKKSEALLKSIFELRALAIAGFMPNLVCCTECGEFEQQLMFFLPLDGLIVCVDCFQTSQFNKETTIKFKVFAPVLSALRHIIFSQAEKMFSFNVTGDSLAQLCFITENYTLLHTEGKFNSLEMYKSLKIPC